MALVPCKYEISYFRLPMYCHISVYEGDGTVSVSTGGIEMGQGSILENSVSDEKVLGQIFI
jgi:xanthine dehydrogenase molybdopterin-binding subunit B